MFVDMLNMVRRYLIYRPGRPDCSLGNDRLWRELSHVTTDALSVPFIILYRYVRFSIIPCLVKL